LSSAIGAAADAAAPALQFARLCDREVRLLGRAAHDRVLVIIGEFAHPLGKEEVELRGCDRPSLAKSAFPCSIPSTKALVKVPFFHALLSIEDSAPVEERLRPPNSNS